MCYGLTRRGKVELLEVVILLVLGKGVLCLCDGREGDCICNFCKNG